MNKIFLLTLGLVIFLALPLLTLQDTSVTAQAPTEDTTPRYVTGSFARDMVWDRQTGIVWVANWYDGTITRLDAETGEVLGDPILDPALEGQNNITERGPVALASDGTNIWIANQRSNIVSVVDRNGNLINSYTTRQNGIDNPVDLFFDGLNMWVLNQGGEQTRGSVVRINTISNSIEQPYAAGRFSTSMTYDGSRVWVTNGLGNSVSVIDAQTGELIEEISVDLFPTSIVFDGRHVWIAHYDGSLKILDVSLGFNEEDEVVLVTNDADFAIEDLAGDPQRPVQLLYAFEHVWVTNVHDGSITAYSAETGAFAETFSTVDDSEFPGTMTNTGNEIWVADWVTQKISHINIEDVWAGNTLNTEIDVTSTPGIWLPTDVPTNTPTPTQTPVFCDPDLPPRMTVGEPGMVIRDFAGNLRLRPIPSLFDNEEINTYPEGSTFIVVSGYVCEDNVAFWEVVMDSDGQQGWFSENYNGNYTIEPVE